MKALVTGAGGFVGRYLVNELMGEGYDVLGIDVLEEYSGNRKGKRAKKPLPGQEDVSRIPPWPEGAEYIRCDILHPEDLHRIVAGWKPGVVFHLAAQSSAGRSFRDPAGTMQTNVMGSLNLFEAVRKLALEAGDTEVKLISVGSCEEYGRREPSEMPLTEDMPVEPLSPYASSKASQTIMALQYYRSHRLDVTVTRSFSHTGPGQTDTFALPAFARQCAEIKLRLRPPVIKVGNLDVIRDFLDVRDVVKAYRLLAEKGRSGETYNVCSGKELPLKGALRSLIDTISIDVRIEPDPDRMRPADVPVLVGDNSKLLDDTSWKQTISSSRMLRELVEYWKKVVELSSDSG